MIGWLEVDPSACGRGLGADAVLYVDDDEPGGDPDRSAANHLYDRTGFTHVDQLHSYSRPDEPDRRTTLFAKQQLPSCRENAKGGPASWGRRAGAPAWSGPTGAGAARRSAPPTGRAASAPANRSG